MHAVDDLSTPMDFEQLLRRRGFEEYIPLFREHAIADDIFGQLTMDDLADIGIPSLGHRIKIFNIVTRFGAYAKAHGGPRSPSAAASARPSYQRAVFSTPALSTREEEAAPEEPLSAPPHRSKLSSLRSVSAPDGKDLRASLLPDDENSAENDALKQRLELNERQLKKLHDTVAKLRYDLIRKFKEAEPLPNPLERHHHSNSPLSATPLSGANTPISPLGPQSKPVLPQQHSSSSVSTLKRQDSRRQSNSHEALSPQDGYFSRGASLTPTSREARFGSLQSLPAGTPTSPTPPELNYSESHSASNPNLMIQNGSQPEPFKKFRCGDSDDAARVLASMFKKYHLDGELSQWRLQIMYGDKARDLLDHEIPLVIFKQLQEQGHKPMFHAKKVSGPKPPPESYI